MVSLGEDFRPVEIEDIAIILKYLELAQYEESNHNIVNLFLWRRYYPLWMYQEEHYLLLVGIHKGKLFSYMPLCLPEYFEEALLKSKRLFDQYGIPFELSCFIRQPKEWVIKLMPHMIAYTESEAADYIYHSEKLRTLSGKKLQKRRNNFNSFVNAYQGRFYYEPLTADNVSEVIEFLDVWPHMDQSEYSRYERLGSRDVLDLYGILPYQGGLIRIDGKVRAFIIGSPSSKRMAQINIEKADPNIRGLYQAIEKLFLESNFLEYEYINREDDMGIESLRRAKQALYPCCMIEKYRITEHETTSS
jgi:uncharacterized protein